MAAGPWLRSLGMHILKVRLILRPVSPPGGTPCKYLLCMPPPITMKVPSARGTTHFLLLSNLSMMTKSRVTPKLTEAMGSPLARSGSLSAWKPSACLGPS